ncbi:MAG: hypothetical protein J0M17_17830 [Planctomycetes bacterium]|nr:hypothetical protein [Planctomycetota bacterium]
MKVLSTDKQLDVLRLATEGNSISTISRLTDAHRDTCSRLLLRFGNACDKFLKAEICDFESSHIQIDEIWTFCRKKQKKLAENDAEKDVLGDMYIYVALDEASKLVIAHRVDKRNEDTTFFFMRELMRRLRIPRRHELHNKWNCDCTTAFRISTDAYPSYPYAIDNTFGPLARHGVLKKQMVGKGKDKKLLIAKKARAVGIEPEDITTSLVERNNLTIRTFMRRLMRKSLGFSKKIENLRAAASLHFAYYNYCWVHRRFKSTAAERAGLINKKWRLTDLYDHLRGRWPQDFFGVDQNAVQHN